MLQDNLNNLMREREPQTMQELFDQSKEGQLYESLTQSLRQAVAGMRKQMQEEMQTIAGQIAQQVLARIPNPQDGRDGLDGASGTDGKDGSPDTPPEIKGKLESLKDEERLDAKAIKNLPEAVNRFITKRGGGGSTLKVNNLSSQITGATRTFTTTNRIGAAHLVFYSSFPFLILPTTDYIASGTTVTLSSSLAFPEAGQSLAIIYEEG